MSNASIKSTLHNTRTVLSFALLGAVVCGAFFGGFGVDLRPAGAIVGGVTALMLKLTRVI